MIDFIIRLALCVILAVIIFKGFPEGVKWFIYEWKVLYGQSEKLRNTVFISENIKDEG